METPKVFESEYRFCLILWENEPINSTKLAKLCNEKLGWSRTTTYTVIRRLSDRGVVKNENAVVTSLVSKDQVQTAEIDELVEKTFQGSIPAFIAAFTKRKKLSGEEVEEIRRTGMRTGRIRRDRRCQSSRRDAYGTYFCRDTEQEHSGGMGDPCGSCAAPAASESAEMDELPAVGAGGGAAGLPVFDGERIQPDSQQGDGAWRHGCSGGKICGQRHPVPG